MVAWAFFAAAAEAATPDSKSVPVLEVAAAPAKDIATLEREAATGSADAQLELAFALDSGAAADPAKAAEWYRRAADQGVGAARLRLGMLYEIGRGVPQSYEEARSQYEQAVALGVAEANLRLGILHLEGWGVPRDPARAVALIEQAANADYRPAQMILSDMYAAGIGTKKDATKAIGWAQRAAVAKDPEAQLRLGSLAMRRDAVKRDVQLAREWFQLSSEQEYSRGMFAMAGTFLKPGASADEAAVGVRWLSLAAENGNSAAMFYLAAFLAMKPDAAAPEQSMAQAHSWLQRASEAGEATASEVLELQKKGSTLREAFQHVMTVPFFERYVQRYAAARAKAESDPTGTHPPVPVKLVNPVYPAALRLTNTTGDVVVDFVVDTTGRVRNAKAIKSAHPGFEKRALEAVRQWVFMPARQNGRLVNTHMQVPVYFRLSDVREGGPKRPDGDTPPGPSAGGAS